VRLNPVLSSAFNELTAHGHKRFSRASKQKAPASRCFFSCLIYLLGHPDARLGLLSINRDELASCLTPQLLLNEFNIAFTTPPKNFGSLIV
jgi:hypothetical protein